ncbi:MAG: lysylphosphatidylglycerol synthase transmembrane domain-containing protein [bacterium]
MLTFIKKYKHIFQIAFSLTLLVILLNYLDFAKAKEIATRVAPEWLLCVVAIYLLDRMLMAWKWGFLLKIAAMRIRFPSAFKMYYLSCFWGFLFPFGVGPDLIRFFKIKQEGYASENAMATIITERVLGLAATMLMIMVSISLLMLHLAGEALQSRFIYIFNIIALLLLAGFIFIFHDRTRKKIFRASRINRLFAKIKLEKYFAAFSIYRHHKGVLVRFIFWSFIEQLVPVFAVYFAAKALAIPLTLLNCLAFAPVSILFERLPISYLGLGVRESSYILLLQLMNVGYTDAFLLSIFMFMTDIISLIPAAIWSFFDSMKPKQVMANAVAENQELPEDKVPVG